MHGHGQMSVHVPARMQFISILEVCCRIVIKAHTCSCIRLYAIFVITGVHVLLCTGGDNGDKGDGNKKGSCVIRSVLHACLCARFY